MKRYLAPHRRGVRLAVVLAGAVSALALAATMAPASAGLQWGDTGRCAEASADMRPNRIERAIRACTAVIENRRSTLVQTKRALNSRGLLFSARGNYGQALEDYQRAVNLDPTDAATLLALGRTQARVNDLDGALASFEAAHREADSADEAADARIASGDVFRERAQWQRAVAAYSEAERLTNDPPRRVRLLLGRGHAEASLGRLDVAITDYAGALSSDLNSVEAMIALADAHRVMAFPAGGAPDPAHYAQARSLYNDAITALRSRRDDNVRRQAMASALAGRGELYLRGYIANTSDEASLTFAARDFDEAVSQDSSNVRALSGRAAAFAQDPAERNRALADLDRALRIAPDSHELYRARANIYADMGDSERSVRDYDQTIRRGGANSYDAYYRRGVIYLEEGDLRRADQSFTQAASLAAAGEVGPGVDPAIARAEALVMRSRAAWGLMDEPGADARAIARRSRDDADMAAALQPRRADFVRATCLTRAVGGGEWDAADLACRRAIDLARDTGDQRQLSDAYGAAGLLQLRRALAGGSNVQEVILLQYAEYDLRRAIEADPTTRSALYRYALGATFECLNRRIEADRQVAAALDADRGVAARFEAHRIRRCQ